MTGGFAQHEVKEVDLEFSQPWELGCPNGITGAFPELHWTTRPSVLLLSVGKVGRWQFVRHADIFNKDGSPASYVSSERQIHVLHCRTSIPSAHIFDCLFSPDSGCAIEVEERPRGEMHPLFTLHMIVQ